MTLTKLEAMAIAAIMVLVLLLVGGFFWHRDIVRETELKGAADGQKLVNEKQQEIDTLKLAHQVALKGVTDDYAAKLSSVIPSPGGPTLRVCRDPTPRADSVPSAGVNPRPATPTAAVPGGPNGLPPGNGNAFDVDPALRLFAGVAGVCGLRLSKVIEAERALTPAAP